MSEPAPLAVPPLPQAPPVSPDTIAPAPGRGTSAHAAGPRPARLAHRLAGALGSVGLRVVLYHHIADASDTFTDGLDVRTSPDLFEAHLRYYQQHYNIVDLQAVLTGDLPPRPLLITFDDAYRSVYDHALPRLRLHRLPAVFFVATAPLSRRELMLDNLLCHLSHTVGIAALSEAVTGRSDGAADLASLIAGVLPALPHARRIALGAELARQFHLDMDELYDQADLYLGPEHLRELSASGIEIGNHTQHHVHCRALTGATAVEAEILTPQAQLQAWSGQPVRCFSYPYGSRADAAPLAGETLRRSGHEAIFLVHGRTNATAHRGPTWYRVSLAAHPPQRLFRRVELWPRLRTLRDRLRSAREAAA